MRLVNGAPNALGLFEVRKNKPFFVLSENGLGMTNLMAKHHSKLHPQP